AAYQDSTPDLMDLDDDDDNPCWGAEAEDAGG
ncbi:MAG: hypothetical protein JWM74_2306, partial [Myxococcaceae bacterium]|nr:hypothetical protein [Myxococcaceae bacterium]